MTIECHAIVGFETGSIAELAVASLYPTVSSAVAPASAKEIYAAVFGWKDDAHTPSFTPGAGWLTATVYVRFTNVKPDSDEYFCNFEDDSGYCWRLQSYQSGFTGRIGLIDAGGTRVDSFGPMAINTWYRIQVKFKHDPSTDIRVWLDDDLVLDLSTFDASAGGSTAWLQLYNRVDPGAETSYEFRGSHMSVLEDDGADIDTESTAPRDYCVKSYQNTTQGHTGDWGSALSSGLWSDAGKTPGNDADSCFYDLPKPSTVYGGINCNDGPRTGPSGDTDLTDGGDIMGYSGTWRVANGVAAFNGRANFSGQLGHDDGPTISDVAFGLIPTGTTIYNHQAIFSAGDAECPTTSDYAAIGVKGVKGGLGIDARLDLFEQWASVLYREALPAAGVDVGVVHAGMIDA